MENLKLLDLAESISDNDRVEFGKYPWLKAYPLIAVLQGSYEHLHVDHLKPLLTKLHIQKGNMG
jgi:hypothetical protein